MGDVTVAVLIIIIILSRAENTSTDMDEVTLVIYMQLHVMIYCWRSW